MTLSAALLALALAPAASAYQFTLLDHPDAAGLTYALGVNNYGHVAGAYLGTDGALHGFVLANGTYHALDVPGATQTIGLDIEENGHVTGTYFDAQGFQHGFRWLGGDTFVSIDVPGAGQNANVEYEFGTGLGTAAARTAHGVTVGWYADTIGQLHGFALDHGAYHMIDFPGGVLTLPGYGTQPIAINDRGMIGGSYVLDTSPAVHGFVLDHGTFTTFDVPGAGGWFGTQVNGLNNRGALVGPFTDADDMLHGYVYYKGELTIIDIPGAFGTEVDCISDNATIVGTWYGYDGVIHGYFATP
jgi:hypothetical protein